MKIPDWLKSIVAGILVAGQAWMISNIIDLKVDVATIKAHFENRNRINK